MFSCFDRLSPLNGGVTIDADQGIVECHPHRKKVAIVGCGPTKHRAPYDDPEWEIWLLNAIPRYDSQRRLRADRFWEMHILEVQSTRDMEFLQACPIPLYMPERYEEIPASVRFPLERCEEFAPSRFYACTFAYQIALALLEGFEEIGLFGVELNLGSVRERTYERMSVAYWLGVAHGRKVKVSGCTMELLNHPLYGIKYHAEKEFVEGRLEELEELIQDEWKRGVW